MNHYIENLNYYNDPRNTEPAKDKIVFPLYDEATDDFVDVELPTKWEVCDLCDGEGKHVNPAIDCGGLREDWADDPDFRRDYFGGRYDVPCNLCGGKRVIKGVDCDALTEELRKAYEEHLEDEYEARAERLAEKSMGA